MAKHTAPSRKALFRAALALNEMTAEAWAASVGVSSSSVSLVLSGYRPGSELVEKIDAFIETHMGKQKALAS